MSEAFNSIGLVFRLPAKPSGGAVDKVLERIIENSGAMWVATGRPRDVSAVLIRTPESRDGELYEVTLPKGEEHPFWRVRVRPMTWEEREGYAKALALGKMHHFGFAHTEVLMVNAHIYNGRRDVWGDSVPWPPKGRA